MSQRISKTSSVVASVTQQSRERVPQSRTLVVKLHYQSRKSSFAAKPRDGNASVVRFLYDRMMYVM